MGIFDGQKKDTEGRDEKGRFSSGNKIWVQAAEKVGRKRIFETPDDLLAACVEYFEWASENPLMEAKAFGTGLILKVPHPRPLTLKGLCVYLGIAERSWRVYRDRDEFAEACEHIEAIMYEQKFAGASVGLFNGNIIARELGLIDKSAVEGNITVQVVDSFDEDPDTE